MLSVKASSSSVMNSLADSGSAKRSGEPSSTGAETLGLAPPSIGPALETFSCSRGVSEPGCETAGAPGCCVVTSFVTGLVTRLVLAAGVASVVVSGGASCCTEVEDKVVGRGVSCGVSEVFGVLLRFGGGSGGGGGSEPEALVVLSDLARGPDVGLPPPAGGSFCAESDIVLVT